MPMAANAAGVPTPPSHKTPQHSAPPSSARAKIAAHDPRRHGRQQQSRRHAPAGDFRQAERRSGSAHGRQLRRAVDHGAAPDKARIKGQTERRQAAQPAQQRRKIQRPPPLSRSGPAAQDGRSHTAAALTVSHCRAGRHPPFPPKTCRLPSTRARSGRHGRQEPTASPGASCPETPRSPPAAGPSARCARPPWQARTTGHSPPPRRAPPTEIAARTAARPSGQAPERQGQPADLRPAVRKPLPSSSRHSPSPCSRTDARGSRCFARSC